MASQIQKFNVTDAILTPWTMPGGRSFLFRSLLWAAALLLLVYYVFGRSVITAYIDMFSALSALEQGGAGKDPAAAMAIMGNLSSVYGSVFLLSIAAWVVMVMLETAMHKNIFRGTDKGMVPLRFGRDEVMVMLAQFVIYLCLVGVYIIGIVILFILMGLAGAGANASGSGAMGAVAGLLTFFGFIALIVGLVCFLMRWAPAAALSVRDGKQRIFDGWPITKGIGWPLFGAYALVGIGGYVFMTIIMIVAMVTVFAGVDFSALEAGTSAGNEVPDFSALTAHFEKLSTKIMLVIALMVYSIFMLLWYMHVWGIANYVAQCDAKNSPNVSSVDEF